MGRDRDRLEAALEALQFLLVFAVGLVLGWLVGAA